MALAFLFPGQGSQSVGMLSAFHEQHDACQQRMQQASDVLGYDLWKIISEGPVEELSKTEITQPAMLTVGVACWDIWQQQGGATPDYMAGHSLGEYTALVCAGAIRFEDAVGLVAERGRLMQSAVPQGEGAMAAILGLDDDQVIAACQQGSDAGVVEAVNFNSPGQVVIAGNKVAVQKTIDILKETGAKRALMLPVSVPSHCQLMVPAAEQLAQSLADVDMQSPSIPVIHNADVSTHSDADEIRAVLKQQLHSPVRWVETIRKLVDNGASRMIECGPGKVLIGLNKRIDKSIDSSAVYDPDTLQAALATGEA